MNLNRAMVAALFRLIERHPMATLQPEDWYPRESWYIERGEPKGYAPILVGIHTAGTSEWLTALIKRDGATHVCKGDWGKDNAFQQFQREAWEDMYRDA